MSKKKKKKKNDSILNEVDQNLDHTYQQLLDEIHAMQLKIEIADKKAKKRAKKVKKKNKNTTLQALYEVDDYRVKVRNEMIAEMQGDTFLDRIMATLNDLAPIVVIIARLVASLILAILSIDIVKVNIKPDFLNKMTAVYNAAMAVC